MPQHVTRLSNRSLFEYIMFVLIFNVEIRANNQFINLYMTYDLIYFFLGRCHFDTNRYVSLVILSSFYV